MAVLSDSCDFNDSDDWGTDHNRQCRTDQMGGAFGGAMAGTILGGVIGYVGTLGNPIGGGVGAFIGGLLSSPHVLVQV